MSVTINGNGTITGYEPVANGSITAAKLASGAITAGALPNGTVIQVQQTVKSDQFTVSANASNFFDITGLSVDITMTSASNKVLVLFTTTWTGNNGQRGSFRVRRCFSYWRRGCQGNYKLCKIQAY